MRVLIAAYACEPGRGSEQGAGWNLVTQLARHHEVWVLTRANNQAIIEADIARSPIPNLHFRYTDIAYLLPIKRLPGGLYIYHYAWHLSLRPLAKALQRQIGFDVVHHLTLGSFRYPSGLANLGVPLVIGPVGGGEETPLALWRSFGWRGVLMRSSAMGLQPGRAARPPCAVLLPPGGGHPGRHSKHERSSGRSRVA